MTSQSSSDIDSTLESDQFSDHVVTAHVEHLLGTQGEEPLLVQLSRATVP